MRIADSIELIKEFPAHNSVEFDGKAHWNMYKTKNIIVNAKASMLYCQKHWGSLSIKTTFKGSEYYETGNTKYLVSENNYLILNQDTEYSSFIDSDADVESFTIHFSPDFINEFISGLTTKSGLFFNQGFEKNDFPEFIEKTYQHDNLVTPILLKIRKLSDDLELNKDQIDELLSNLLQNMLQLNANVKTEVNRIDALRESVKLELYKRLNYAKEYIDSCYDQNISLEKISTVICMNSEYFIRQFKKYFKITPIQYLIKKRMEAAKIIISTSDISISEVCQQVGYSDLTSFGKLFRKYYHISPDGFKKLNARA